jgi:hypothetical protein
MNTSRAHTAIAALAAQRQALEARLSIVEAALETEGQRSFKRPRGQGAKKVHGQVSFMPTVKVDKRK